MNNDDVTPVRYVLGRVSDKEREEFERRFLAYDTVFEELLAVEDDLVDAYVRGELSSDDRRDFESSYLTTPERRERVAFATTLARQPPAHRAAPQTFGWLDRFRAFFAPRATGLQLALASLLVVIACGGVWLVVETTSLRDDVERERAERSAAEQVARASAERERIERERADQLTAQLEAERALKEATPKPEEPAPAPRTPLFVTAALSPGIVRDSGAIPRVHVPAQATTLRLRLSLEGEATHTRYRAVLKHSRGTQLTSHSGLRPKKGQHSDSVTVDVSADRLAGGTYRLTLIGQAAGASEEVADYAFRVDRR